MKPTLIICMLVAFASLAFMMSPKKKRVIFFGDSITQAGIEPGGYIDIIGKELQKNEKKDKYELIGAGISGNKVPDLQKRLEKDVLSKKPDLVFVYIGINDVWHFTHPKTNGQGTPANKYEASLIDVINKIKASGASVVLCTPSVIGEKNDGTNAQDKMLEEYAAISRKVAKTTGSQLLDLRKAFIDYLKENNKENQEEGILTTDGVHLNDRGNRFVAEQMLAYLAA